MKTHTTKDVFPEPQKRCCYRVNTGPGFPFRYFSAREKDFVHRGKNPGKRRVRKKKMGEKHGRHATAVGSFGVHCECSTEWALYHCPHCSVSGARLREALIPVAMGRRATLSCASPYTFFCRVRARAGRPLWGHSGLRARRTNSSLAPCPGGPPTRSPERNSPLTVEKSRCCPYLFTSKGLCSPERTNGSSGPGKTLAPIGMLPERENVPWNA